MPRVFESAWSLMKVIVVFALSISSVSAEKPARTAYFVSVDGDDANVGTLAEPWQTISKANRELRAGDTLFIRAGEYDEIIDPTNSGKPGQPIRYTAYEDEDVVIRGKPEKGPIVTLREDHIQIQGLTISYGHGLQLGNWAWVEVKGDHCVIRDCTIRRVGDPLQMVREGYLEIGVRLGGSYNTVQGNTIRGVTFGVKTKNIGTNNTIRDNTISWTGRECITVGSEPSHELKGLLIEGNVLEHSAVSDGIQFRQDLEASYPSSDLSNWGTIIRDNVIRFNNENAIDLKGARHVVIDGNMVYGTVGSNDGALNGWNRSSLGTIMRGTHASSQDIIIRRNVLYDNASGISVEGDGFKIYHNTLVANNRDHTGPDSDFLRRRRPAFTGVKQYSDYTNVAIVNNIIAEHNASEVTLKLSATDYGLYIDHNLYHNAAAVRFVNVVDRGSYVRYAFAAWQQLLQEYETVDGKEVHSQKAPPGFVNVPADPVGLHHSFDFRLSSESPAIDAGGALTWALSSGSGNEIVLQDAGYFHDGYGATEGDLVTVGRNDPVRIETIDRATNTIIVDRSISWREGDAVTLPYHGAGPDIGAYEIWNN